jgi:hypothetical protein
VTAKIENLAARRARELAKRSAADRAAPAARSTEPTGKSPRRCPICGNPRSDAHRPFCSRRCADIDLGRWLKEGYRVPSEEPVEKSEREAED